MTAPAIVIRDRPGRILSPVDRISEVLFGLIMALTFTGTLSVATADRAEVRDMLIGALGCNIAWGMVDAVMYLMATLIERGRNLSVLRRVRHTSDPAEARALIADALPPLVASTMQPAELDVIRGRLAALPEPPARPGFTGDDLKGAVGVFLLVFLSTLPVAVPFLFTENAHRALRISNGIALVMLFIGGYELNVFAGRAGWRGGLVMLAIGVALVWATIALGG
ncbi:MAG TPA: VIT1/CCC1 transporter family protein [Castellaniella sp.]|nr:VIT1/CCC1 transporter family protein [Castellaniella sp.]